MSILDEFDKLIAGLPTGAKEVKVHPEWLRELKQTIKTIMEIDPTTNEVYYRGIKITPQDLTKRKWSSLAEYFESPEYKSFVHSLFNKDLNGQD